MKKTILEFKNFTLEIDGIQKIKNLNFILYEGDRYIFNGPNGLGKSTVLKLIMNGLTKDLFREYDDNPLDDYDQLVVHGEINDWNGINILKQKNTDANYEIAYLSQNFDFEVNLKVRDIFANRYDVMHENFNEEEVMQYLNAFHLEDIIDKKVKKLSGGLKRIVMLINILIEASHAKILLLDEPLNDLSFRNGHIFNQLLNQIIERNPNLCILLISHCIAIDFVDNSIYYNADNHNYHISNYEAYDCFKKFG